MKSLKVHNNRFGYYERNFSSLEEAISFVLEEYRDIVEKNDLKLTDCLEVGFIDDIEFVCLYKLKATAVRKLLKLNVSLINRL